MRIRELSLSNAAIRRIAKSNLRTAQEHAPAWLNTVPLMVEQFMQDFPELPIGEGVPPEIANVYPGIRAALSDILVLRDQAQAELEASVPGSEQEQGQEQEQDYGNVPDISVFGRRIQAQGYDYPFPEKVTDDGRSPEGPFLAEAYGWNYGNPASTPVREPPPELQALTQTIAQGYLLISEFEQN